MRMKISIPLSVMAILTGSLIFASFTFVPAEQKTVNGKIVGSGDEGISDAYVYVIAGEEETLSVKDGKFSLNTWQPLPVTLIIEHADFEKQQVIIQAPVKPLTVKMKAKKIDKDFFL